MKKSRRLPGSTRTSRLRKKRLKAKQKQIHCLGYYLRVEPLPIGVMTRLAPDLMPGETQTVTIEFIWTSGKGPTYFPDNGEHLGDKR